MATPEDQKLIAAFVQNDRMFDAVRRVLLQGILGENFASKNWVHNVDRKQSDSAFGKEVKLGIKAQELIEQRFDDLKRIGGASNPQHPPVNHAR